jgi:high-affinity nickel-transport protein
LRSAASEPAFHAGLILTAIGFGFRHGIDWDHIAALTDITSSQPHPRRSMFLATLYALGHALVVLALGAAAILLAARLPGAVDATMARVVGATLVALGLYVLYALTRERRAFRMRSRWMLVFSGVRRGRRWVRQRLRREQLVEILHDHDHSADGAHDHDRASELVAVAAAAGHLEPGRVHRHVHRHAGPMPDDAFVDYAPRTAFGIGMLHGVGAETPTQLLIFLTAAGAGGKGVGLLLLVCFLFGLLTSNTVVALAGTLGFLGAARNFTVYVAVSLATAVISLAIGLLLLLGSSTALPALFGG